MLTFSRRIHHDEGEAFGRTDRNCLAAATNYAGSKPPGDCPSDNEVLVYTISAEWLGSVAGITGVYLLGYVFAGSEFKADIERSFYALGHALLIPLFFVSIGLSSGYRALAGQWTSMSLVLLVGVGGKLFGCGLAALGSGMDRVRSLRIGCGMISRGGVELRVATDSLTR